MSECPAPGPDPHRLLVRALDVVGHLHPHQHATAPAAQKRALDAQLLREAARDRGIPLTPLSGDTTLFGPAWPGAPPGGLVIHKNMPHTLSGLNRSVTNNKHLTKRVLAARGVPVARGQMVSTFEQAREVFARMDPPVVTKPLVGSGGRGVTVGITTEAQLRAACQEITDRDRRIVIEEMVAGVDLRIMTIGGSAVAATLRVPANVVGDGIATISELVAAKNTARATNAYLMHSPLAITPAVEERLAAGGMTPASVPPAGQRVFLQRTANISAGGDNYEITGLVHPDLLELAERAAACFPGATHAGMDILAERIDAGLADQRAIVCEVNLNNEIGMHVLPMYGPPTPVHEMLIESVLFPDAEAGQEPSSPWPEPPRTRESLRPAPASSNPPPMVTIDDLDAIIADADPTPATPTTPEASSLRELDEERLSAQFTRSGYTDPHFRGALVFAAHHGQDAVVHRSGRSVVSAELARRPEALFVLARELGVPVAAPRNRTGGDQSDYRCDLLLIDGEQIAALLVSPSSATDTPGTTDPASVAHPSIALPGCPFPELLRYAQSLGGPIGHTPILEVRFTLHAEHAGRHWALCGIDPDPVLARFASPRAGTTTDPYPAAAAALLNAGSYVIPREQ